MSIAHLPEDLIRMEEEKLNTEFKDVLTKQVDVTEHYQAKVP